MYLPILQETSRKRDKNHTIFATTTTGHGWKSRSHPAVRVDVDLCRPWIGFIAPGENDTFLHRFVSGRYAGEDFAETFEEIYEGFGAGSTESQHLFMVDIGYGKRIHLSDCTVRAIVPTLELHYMHASSADSPFGLTGGIFGDNVDVLNLTLGATAYVGDRSALQVGFGIPLHSNQSASPGGVSGTIDTDQYYDWELLVHWTVFSR